MKTYIFVGYERKGPPRHEFTVNCDSPEEAIRQAKYYPYDPADFVQGEEPSDMGIEQTVFTYYGLNKDVDAYDCGNGQGGYGTILIEYDQDSDTTKLYPSN